MRASLAAAAAVLVLLAGPGPAAAAQTTTSVAPATPELTADQAGPGLLLDAADRVELASTLADATEETGVCFGYFVSLSGDGSGGPGDEALSNGGPGVAAEQAADAAPGSCTKGTLELVVSLNYTSSSSESEDSAGFSVRSTVADLDETTARDRLVALTDLSEKHLLGDDDDLALRNATAALPLLVGGATPAAVATGTTAPNGDGLTGSPGSDWLRAHGLGIAIAVALLVVGLLLVVGGLTGRRQAGQPKRPGGRGPKRPSGSAGAGGSSSTTPTP